MELIRKPVVAGSFYPGDAEVLAGTIDNFLKQAEVKNEFSNSLGIISPHAGYVYSGQCAAYGFNAIKQKDFDLAVLIAPSHRYGGFKFSVGAYEAYETPLGQLPVDNEYVEKLLADPEFEFYPEAHMGEHSLEVQLPFLQRVKPQVRIVPILFGDQSVENSKYLADRLVKVFKDRMDKTVFIISSDLSHYHDSETATRLDSLLADNVKERDVEQMEENIHTHKSEACGFGGILTLMNLANQLGYEKVENLNLTNSGYVSGDFGQVVGYLSSVFY